MMGNVIQLRPPNQARLDEDSIWIDPQSSWTVVWTGFGFLGVLALTTIIFLFV